MNPLANQRAIGVWAGAATGFQTRRAFAVPKSQGKAKIAVKTNQAETKRGPDFLSWKVKRTQIAITA